MRFPAMPTQVTCPKCQTKFVVQVRTVLDVGEEPELKEQFLKGEVNLAECPKCGAGGTLGSPLLYHDPEKELLISYVPAELGMSASEQEQFVGSLVNAVMNSVPAEQRKGYFLQPKTAFTLDSLYDTILEADGISKEALERQRAQFRLLNALLSAADDEETLKKLVDEHRKELDYSFFLLLSDIIDAQEQGGQADAIAPLMELREKLLKLASPAMPTVAPEQATYDELIELLQGQQAGEAWSTTIALNRTRLDYGFFQHLTAKIEAAESAKDKETAERLTALRQRILDELDAQNKMVREAEDEASLLIMQLSEAEDLEAALREHRAELNEVFFGVLSRYEATARARNNAARAEKLGRMLEAAISVLEEQLPPPVRLINKLLRAEHPDGTNAVLEEHRGMLSNEFLETLDKYVASLEGRENPDLADHLKKVRGQIVAKMTIQRA